MNRFVPDLIDDFEDRLRRFLQGEGAMVSELSLRKLLADMRMHWGREKPYIRKTNQNVAKILISDDEFRRLGAVALAKKHKITRQTVYRIIKKRGCL